MNKAQLVENLLSIISKIDNITNTAKTPDQIKKGNIGIVKDNMPTLALKCNENYYGVGINSPGSNTDSKRQIIKLLEPYASVKEAYEQLDNPFTESGEKRQNIRVKIEYEDIERVIYSYAGVKKENMEQEFRKYLESYTTLVAGTINIYASTLRLGNNLSGVYDSVRETIEFNNFYEISDIDLFSEQDKLIKDIIPAQNDDNGNLSAALGKYRLFLQYLEVVKQMNLYDENPDNFDVNANVHWYFKISDRNNEYPIKATLKSVVDKLEIKFDTGVAKNKLENIFAKNMNFIDSNIQEVGDMIDKKLQEKIDLLKHKKQIILQGSPGTGKTRLAKEIAYCLITNEKLSSDNTERKEELKKPAIINPDETLQNKTPDEIYEEGLELIEVKQEFFTILRKTKFTVSKIENNKIYIKNRKNTEITLTKKKIIGYIENKNYTETGGHNSYEQPVAQFMNDEVLKTEKVVKDIQKQKKLVDYSNQYKLIQFHPAYSYEDFVRGIVAKTTDKGVTYETQNKVLAEMAENAFNNPDEKYVLIIDEINRANLAAVLGELIYALEYRGEAVESMYAIKDENGDESREIILPENLYIIGTMNTADRSVGHIDYAIRRRFAFVNINTDRNIIEGQYPASLTLFDEIEKLFDDKLSEEFDKDDVMIGHSYFLTNDLEMAWEYQIKPILYEYAKDGVLTCEKDKINKLFAEI